MNDCKGRTTPSVEPEVTSYDQYDYDHANDGEEVHLIAPMADRLTLEAGEPSRQARKLLSLKSIRTEKSSRSHLRPNSSHCELPQHVTDGSFAYT